MALSWAVLILAAVLPQYCSSVVEANPVDAAAAPPHSYSSFTYPVSTTERYATPLKSPASIPTPYAPPFSKVSSLLPSGVTYTTYSLNPTGASSQGGKYGQSAYAALWESQHLTYTDEPPFTTTVSPTPIPKSELAFPPPLPVVPADVDKVKGLTLPANFVWGAASSAWQVEGGLKLAGRGPSVLDATGAVPGSNDSNVNAMFYYTYKQDILRLAKIGMPYVCFSIPWTRVVPFGVKGSPVNTEALKHYDDLINFAIANGIKPIVTIVHYDLPISVPYSDPNFSEHYLYYAKQIIARYGDRVPYWVSFNEPNLQPVNNALTNVLVAHANLYDWYKQELKGNGQITMKFANNLPIPLDPTNPEDVKACFRYQDFSVGVMSNPLFLGKQIPESVLSTKGIEISPISKANLSLIHNKIDFFSFDPYSSQYGAAPPGGIDACAADSSNPLWPTCVVTSNDAADGWLIGEQSSVSYSFIAPQHVRQQFTYIWNTFRPSGILVAEFGFPVFGEYLRPLDAQRYDLLRTSYYQEFLTELLLAVHEDGVNVIGTLAWCFIETNEFGSTNDHYGLQTVNHTTFERMYKRSFFDYVDFFHSHVKSS